MSSSALHFFEMWVESENHKEQSAVENEIYDKETGEIKALVGAKIYHDISDNVLNLACEAECAGFENGFRYGILFMNSVLKGDMI